MGRTGRLLAIEHFGVEPDMICLAKGIASGMPLGALVTRAELMDWPPGSHASTFGGNPVCCRAALATLDLLEREYLANAAARGEELRRALEQLVAECSHLAAARGIGLMQAVDVVDDRGQPDTERRQRIILAAYLHGLLLLGCGKAGIRFCPALCVSREQVAKAMEILREVALAA
jgi:4-aminobutyrate aminotransferase